MRRRLRRSTPSAANRRRRTRLIASLAVAAIGSLALAPASFANFYSPEYGGSPNADHIHSLYIIVLVMAIIVFVVVEAALVYSVWKFRAKKGAIAAQIHGNTRLEIGWTVGAAVILLALAVITFVKLPSIINPPNSDADGLVLSASLNKPQPPNGRKLVICVQGRQFIWRYSYSSGGTNNCLNATWDKQLAYSYTMMEVPANTTVVLDIQSTDVIHSWWVPQLGGKVDAVPGYTTYTWFKAPHAGVTYRGQCAQLCGTNHAAMIAEVKVVTPAQYTEWLTSQAQAIKAANAQVAQLRAVLTANGNYGTT